MGLVLKISSMPLNLFARNEALQLEMLYFRKNV